MIAAQIVGDGGPEAVVVSEVPEPDSIAPELADSGDPIRIAVRAASVSFPELLQSRGQYQIQPPMPFVPGSEVGGIVEQAPAGSGFSSGDRVFAYCLVGGFAEQALAPSMLTFPLPEELDYAQGAAIVSNYHTAYFALAMRGRCVEGERVLVHGAAGGVGTAALQVAKALGLEAIAVVSSDEKEAVAREAGCDRVVRSDGDWKDEMLAIGGVDVVLDTVGDRALDSLRALREDGRLLIVGFASGEIPEIKVNRLLLRNVEVVGVGYGAYTFSKPEVSVEIGKALDGMIRRGFVRPIIGARFPLEQAAAALAHLDERRAVGKVVLEVS